MKIKICYDHGYNDIGVVIVTKWRYYLFCLRAYFLALGTLLLKPFTGAFPSATHLDVRHRFIWPMSFKIIDILWGIEIRATIR